MPRELTCPAGAASLYNLGLNTALLLTGIHCLSFLKTYERCAVKVLLYAHSSKAIILAVKQQFKQLKKKGLEKFRERGKF